MTSPHNESLKTRIATALGRARAALPPQAMAYATRDPQTPSSINTLAMFDRAMEESEFAVALDALAGIAYAVRARGAVWSALDEAARLMNFDAQQRASAHLPP